MQPNTLFTAILAVLSFAPVYGQSGPNYPAHAIDMPVGFLIDPFDNLRLLIHSD
jgi:hypothetical protein